jgi:predicted RNase H-like HicB family nuclease
MTVKGLCAIQRKYDFYPTTLQLFMKFSAVVRKGDKQYVALCPELDVVSQGPSIESALKNLEEAVGLFLEDSPAYSL